MRPLGLDEVYRYEDIQQEIQYLKNTYPDYVQVYALGKSEDGREIDVLQIGNGPIPIVITAGVHGRETINPIVILKIFENYLQLATLNEPVVVDFDFVNRLLTHSVGEQGNVRQLFYELSDCTIEHNVANVSPSATPVLVSENRTEEENLIEEEKRFQAAIKADNIPMEYDVKVIFDTFTFYVVPLLNPDGYEIALGGFNTIRNPYYRKQAIASGIPHEEWKDNARGVDINRNFPSVTWKAKFPGDQPASESETRALIQLFAMVPAVGYLDLHSRGKAIYYYKGAMSQEYNHRQKEIADRLSDVTGYELMPPESEIEELDSGGNTVHYFSEQYHQPAITIETVLDLEPFPLDVRHQSTTFREIFLAPLEFGIAIVESD